MKRNQIKTEEQAVQILIGSGIVLDMKKRIQYWTFGVKPSVKQIAAGKVLDNLFEDKTDLTVSEVKGSPSDGSSKPVDTTAVGVSSTLRPLGQVSDSTPKTSGSTRRWSTVWLHQPSCMCKTCIKGESFKMVKSLNPSGATYKLMHGKKFSGVAHKSVNMKAAAISC